MALAWLGLAPPIDLDGSFQGLPLFFHLFGSLSSLASYSLYPYSYIYIYVGSQAYIYIYVGLRHELV